MTRSRTTLAAAALSVGLVAAGVVGGAHAAELGQSQAGLDAPSGVVTLGDSYSSGLGAGGYTNDCDNTPNAWGSLIFGDAVSDRTMLACSGATIPTVQDQVERLAENPGAGRLVTVTVGGNDVGFAAELQNCFFSDCTGKEDELRGKAEALEDPLAELYEQIKTAAPDDTLIVGGYPMLVPDPDVRSGCSALAPLLSDAERQMVRRLVATVNDTIDAAAERAGVTSVTTGLEERYDGHEACNNADEDWLYGLRIQFGSDGADAKTAHGSGDGAAVSTDAEKLEVTAEQMAQQADVEEVYISPQSNVVGGWIKNSFHPAPRGQAAYAAAFEDAWGAAAS